MRAFFREILGALIVAVVIFLLLQTTVQSFIVVGSSMEPGFQHGQRLLINKIAYAFHEPKRGDVIVFHPPDNQQADYIKRIIGLPGESVEIKQGTVYIYKNDEVFSLAERIYIKNPPNYTFHQKKIPENNYFVLGDNRNNSNDSHNGWTVRGEDIIGKAWLSIWPPDKWGLVPHYSPQEQLASSMNKQLPSLGVD